MRKAGVLLGTLAMVVITAAHAGPSASPRAGADVRALGKALETTHPAPFRNVSRARFRAEVDRLARRAPGLSDNELLVGLMRIAALPGERNGHTGLFPLDSRHRGQVHLYPLRLYDFADGIFVVDEAGEQGLVGARLVAIAGIPVERLLELVRPLVPRDNPTNFRGEAPHFLLVAEVLDGLGVAGGVGPRELTLERPGGERVTTTLSPVPRDEFTSVFADELHGHYPALLPRASRPFFLSQMGKPLWVRTLAGGRALYVGYNSALAPTHEISERIARLVRNSKVRRVVVDVRANGGGDNTSYNPLLNVLASPQVSRRGRLYLLAGRATFSAAGNFAADVDRYTKALLVGEPTGGGVNQYGDATSVTLPVTGWNVRVATEYTQRGEPGDRRLAVEPDIRVELRSADYFAKRDPVLARALRGL
jgi:Peptidase family S41